MPNAAAPPTRTRRWQRGHAGLAALALAAVTGCGGSPTAQVSGRVEYADGSPITGAVRTISFRPTDDTFAEQRRAAQGQIAEDGSFEMYTRRPGDGVYKGKYKVTVIVLKDPNLGGLLVPERYAAIDDTPLEIEVTEDRDDLLYQIEKE
ncbi:hypothetical protein [Botrimarina sp.]|uniref:hypothetical protein n=1 Tax=Botrimarina sp. TaxID=2795802 RepID=UPI0032EE6168